MEVWADNQFTPNLSLFKRSHKRDSAPINSCLHREIRNTMTGFQLRNRIELRDLEQRDDTPMRGHLLKAHWTI